MLKNHTLKSTPSTAETGNFIMITQKQLYDDCFRGEIIEFLLKRGFRRAKRGIFSDKLIKGNRSEEIFLVPLKSCCAQFIFFCLWNDGKTLNS